MPDGKQNTIVKVRLLETNLNTDVVIFVQSEFTF